MKLSNQELMKEFFSQEKDNYPDLSLEDMTEIVHTPWRNLKIAMEEGSLDEVRIKYFGTFKVHKGRAVAERAKVERKFKEGTINEKTYMRVKTVIDRYLENEEE